MWGKVLGALLGAGLGMLLAFSPLLAAVLALAGGLVGHLAVDREPEAPRTERPPSRDELLGGPRPQRARALPDAPPRRRQPTDEDQALADGLCPVFIEVARVDGPVTQAEVRVARDFFARQLGFDEVAMEAVRLGLKAALAAPPQDLAPLVVRARPVLRPALRVEAVRALYELGLADGELQRSELDALRQVVAAFNLGDEQLRSITALLFGDAARHYEVLQVPPDVDDEALKSAYRRLAAEHHPDRAADGGARFREIKDAWDALRRLRGL